MISNNYYLVHYRLLMDANGGNMDRKWQRETLVPVPTTVAPWPAAAQFANR